MGWARDLTAHEQELCQALGEVVIFWNHVEQSFGWLLQRATHLGASEGRLWSLIAQLTPMQLKDAMIAVSADHAPDREAHLRHCGALFNREREYRNHYVHGPITFRTTDKASEALVSGVVARGGTLRIHGATVSSVELTAFRDRLGKLQAYLAELLEDSRTLRGGKPLSELAMPPLPPRPIVTKHSWWEVHGH